MKLKTILVPVDFSDLSGLALQYASRLARCAEGRVIAVYANSFEPPPYFTASRLADFERQYRESFHEAETALRQFAGPGPEIRIVEALPADGIRQVAEEAGADLIVMGTHGRTGFNRIMLGSVAERVLRETSIPVLTVRGGASEFQNILCPVNDTPPARAALEAATELARCFGGRVIALHVPEKDSERNIADLCNWLPQDARSHCTVREVSGGKDAAHEIVEMARGTACDLLAIGAQHRRFFDSTTLGSTTARVVRHSPCPVLTVPAA